MIEKVESLISYLRNEDHSAFREKFGEKHVPYLLTH